MLLIIYETGCPNRFSSMNLIMPSLYMGPIEYYRSIIRSEQVEIEKWEYFKKQTLRNRCYIYGANGILPLVIPTIHGNRQKSPMRDVRISYDSNWQKTHWKSIESAYRSSSWFEFYEEEFHPFYNKKIEFLFDFNEGVREAIFGILDMEKKVTHTLEYNDEVPPGFSDSRKHFERYRAEIDPLPYHQVFESRNGFIPNLSIIDLIFNLGNDAYGRLVS